MSQRKEKYARELGRRMAEAEYRLDRLEETGVTGEPRDIFDVEVISDTDDAFEEHLLRARYTAECKENARNKAHADRRMRRILEAEEAAERAAAGETTEAKDDKAAPIKNDDKSAYKNKKD